MAEERVTLDSLAAEVRALRARVAELEERMRGGAQAFLGSVQQQQHQQQQQQQQQLPPSPWQQQQQQQIEPGESWGLKPPGAR